MTESQKLERDIGRIEGKLERLIVGVDKLGTAVEKQGNSDFHLEQRLKSVEDKIETVMPVAIEFGHWKQRGLAVLFIFTILMSLFGSFLLDLIKAGFAALMALPRP